MIETDAAEGPAALAVEGPEAPEGMTGEEHRKELPGVLVLPRASWWEDVLSGVRLAGGLGAMFFPIIAAVLHLAGSSHVTAPLRSAVLSLMAAAAAGLARGQVRSQVVLDPDERRIHDAVWIRGRTYLQEGLPFERVSELVLASREAARATDAPKRCGPPEEAPVLVESRLEVRDAGGRLHPLSDWVREDGEERGRWWRLTHAVRVASGMLDLPVQEEDRQETGARELERIGVWVASMAITVAMMVTLAG